MTTTGTKAGKFMARFFHLVFEEEIGRVKGHFGPINTVAFHPHGTRWACPHSPHTNQWGFPLALSQHCCRVAAQSALDHCSARERQHTVTLPLSLTHTHTAVTAVVEKMAMSECMNLTRPILSLSMTTTRTDRPLSCDTRHVMSCHVMSAPVT